MKTNIFKSAKGFTLVELLVVIGILGILAAGLLATIDPLEQLKKGTDNNNREASIEMVNAATRYYASHQAWPWDSSANGGGDCSTATPGTLQTVQLTGATGCINSLIADGELKTTFNQASAVLKSLVITGSSTGVIVCYKPGSKSEQNKAAETRYSSAGATTTGALGTLYWCAQ